jgi:hypothetical protein
MRSEISAAQRDAAPASTGGPSRWISWGGVECPASKAKWAAGARVLGRDRTIKVAHQASAHPQRGRMAAPAMGGLAVRHGKGSYQPAWCRRERAGLKGANAAAGAAKGGLWCAASKALQPARRPSRHKHPSALVALR